MLPRLNLCIFVQVLAERCSRRDEASENGLFFGMPQSPDSKVVMRLLVSESGICDDVVRPPRAYFSQGKPKTIFARFIAGASRAVEGTDCSNEDRETS